MTDGDDSNKSTTSFGGNGDRRQEPPRQHPMVAVPDAIRTVLRETARVVLEGGRQRRQQQSVQVVPVRRQPEEEDDNSSSPAFLSSLLLNRIVAEDVIMSEPGYPPSRFSVMDGYAIRVSEFSNGGGGDGGDNETKKRNNNEHDAGGQCRPRRWTHAVVDMVYAGNAAAKKLLRTAATRCADSSPLQLPPAYYVTTGAVVPDTFDCVVPVEDCAVSTTANVAADKDDDGPVALLAVADTATIKVGKWIRPVGCDIPAGDVVVPKGHVLDPVAIGLVLQAGVRQVRVMRPITVGVLSTGNELLAPSNDDDGSTTSWLDKPKGTIPDVDRPILLSLLSTYGTACAIEPVDMGLVRDDDVDAATAVIKSHLKRCQVVITTGGISMGETDILEDVLVNRLGGTLHFGRMHMKPGKPTTFVTLPPSSSSTWDATRLVFAMPGNPVSATVCTQLLVRPCLDLLYRGCDVDRSGDAYGDSVGETVRRLVDNAFVHREVQVVLEHDVDLDAERPEYHRVVVARKGTEYRARSTGVQQSSRLMSLRDANGLLVLPLATKDHPKALAGESYTVLLLSSSPSLIDAVVPPMRLYESMHLNEAKIDHKQERTFRVGIVRVGTEDETSVIVERSLSERVTRALSGSKSGSVSVTSTLIYSGPPDGLFSFLASSDDASSSIDMNIVVCEGVSGSDPKMTSGSNLCGLRSRLALAQNLRSKLSKVADAMALQVRRGVAEQEPAAALFEVVIGFCPVGRGSMVVLLPEQGLDGGLANARGLLKHALEIARDGVDRHGHRH